MREQPADVDGDGHGDLITTDAVDPRAEPDRACLLGLAGDDVRLDVAVEAPADS